MSRLHHVMSHLHHEMNQLLECRVQCWLTGILGQHHHPCELVCHP